MHSIKILSILILLTSLFISCTETVRPCTLEFQMATVVVLMPDGEPAESVQITATNRETGETHDPCEDEGTCQVNSDGQHLIFHDGLMGELTKEATWYVVTGTKDDLSFSEEFSFRNNGCHIEQVAGPDTVSLSFN